MNISVILIIRVRVNTTSIDLMFGVRTNTIHIILTF